MATAAGRNRHGDPHAHAIHKPGKRLLARLPLRFLLGRTSGGGRAVNAPLSLTSYIDFLIVTVIFLLSSFSASGEVAVDRSITVPLADNGIDAVEAPMVAVNGSQVLVDGAPAGSTRAIGEAHSPERIAELFDLLRGKRQLWQSFHPGKPFPGACILQIDENVPALVAKSVFQTAAYAGYTNPSFMVRRRGRSAGE